MNALVQAKADFSPTALATRSRELKASQVMVTTATGELKVLDVPGSNRVDGFKSRLAEVGQIERVVFLDNGGRRLDEIAAIAAAAETRASADTQISLLAVQQLGTLINGMAQTQLRHFSEITIANLKSNQDQVALLRTLATRQDEELQRTRAELRQLHKQRDDLRALVFDMTQKVRELESQKDAAQDKKDAMVAALEKLVDKGAEMLALVMLDDDDDDQAQGSK